MGKVFNMGSDEMISMQKLAERVIRVTGSTSRIHNVSYEQVFGKGFEDLNVRQPSLQKIKGAIGFAPVISLDTTIADIAASLRGAPAGERAA